MPITEKQKIPQNQQQNHTSVYSSHYVISGFLAKMLHQTTVSSLFYS